MFVSLVRWQQLYLLGLEVWIKGHRKKIDELTKKDRAAREHNIYQSIDRCFQLRPISN
ncbi:hypothetical protein [Clostridium kluyveri]|uniref:hypothetical protein n=1 Tax=Clostridium kluyveri TaxID=1534 RepID=UPI002AFE6A33|nr:hypothetical protein [Clostridium kluyveri]